MISRHKSALGMAGAETMQGGVYRLYDLINVGPIVEPRMVGLYATDDEALLAALSVDQTAAWEVWCGERLVVRWPLPASQRN